MMFRTVSTVWYAYPAAGTYRYTTARYTGKITKSTKHFAVSSRNNNTSYFLVSIEPAGITKRSLGETSPNS